MPNPIRYEMVEMFVDTQPAFNLNANSDPITGHARLDFIQSHELSFNVDRSPLKQLGSSGLATRQTQLAPDVNFSINYLLNDGWNENFIGLNINTGAYENPFNKILTSDLDRNFYIFITDRMGLDSNASTHATNGIFSDDSDLKVLGVGNCYISEYNINLNVNGLAEASCNFVGANATLEERETSFIKNPVLNTAGSGETTIFIGRFFINDSSRQSRYLTGFQYVFDSGCPYYGCSIQASPVTLSGLSLGFDFDNFQSIDISIPFERKSLYGFGNNYPFYRKIQKPIIGTMSLVSIVDTFNVENISRTFEAEDKTINGFDFDIKFANINRIPKLGIKIQNARLDSYSISQEIGPVSQIQTSWSFEINETTGILMSGSYGLKIVTNRTTESINL